MNTKRYLSVLMLALFATMAFAQENMDEMIERGLSVARAQSLIMAKSLESDTKALPRSFAKGKLVTSDYHWWCSGFFPGVLWQLYSDNGDEQLRRYAELYTDRVEMVKKKKDTHDLGFMLYCSFGQGYNLTGNKHYLDVIIEGSGNLIGRYDDKVKAIKSWEPNERWKYPVIIDNMMNLEMLSFATRMTKDSKYLDIANTHAKTTIKNHFRDDYSTFHVISYDPATGQPHAKNTAQGYSDPSAWARGQAWGLYGYTMMYRETKQKEYLEQARNIAKFIVEHPRLPEDGIPYWDFDAPNIPDALRDASAGAVICSALIELSQLDSTADSKLWLETAERQLRALSSSAYLVLPGELGGFILKHSVGSLPGKSEVDVPLTYADYYYIEALLRMKKLRASR